MPCKICGYEAGHARGCPKYSGEAIAPVRFNEKEPGMRESYFGTEHEVDLVDEVDVKNPEYLAELKKMGAEKRGDWWYLPRRKAIELAKKFQPWDPENPDVDFLRELRVELQDRFKEAKDLTDIKAYTSAGKTPLDVFHGMDAFIAADQGGREIIVGLDTKLRRDELEDARRRGGFTRKGSIAIGEVTMPEDDEDRYLEEISLYADLIEKEIRRTGKDEIEKAA